MDPGVRPLSFVDAAIIELDDLYVAIPRPEGWRPIDIDRAWTDDVVALVRDRLSEIARPPSVDVEDDAGDPRAPEPEEAAAALLAADAEGAVVAFATDALRAFLGDLDPAVVLVGVEEGRGSTLVATVLGASILEPGASFEEIAVAVVEAHDTSPAGPAVVTVDRAVLPDRTMLRVASVLDDDPDLPAVARATFVVELLASDTVVVLTGSALGRGAGILVDVWGDIATEVAAVTAALPDDDQLTEAPT